MRTLLFILLGLLYSLPALHAGDPNRLSHSLKLHAGYANMLEGTRGLTNSSENYMRKLCSGVSWNMQYSYRYKDLVLGMLYSGFTSSGKLTYSSDHIYTHYWAPQFGGYFLTGGAVDLKATFGLGYLSYLNNSTVYGKERRVAGGNIAGNVGFGATYYLTSKIGLSFDLQYIVSTLRKINILYHDEVIVVKYPRYRDQRPLSLSRMNISGGISYFF